jgi:hypothetical protein
MRWNADAAAFPGGNLRFVRRTVPLSHLDVVLATGSPADEVMEPSEKLLGHVASHGHTTASFCQ